MLSRNYNKTVFSRNPASNGQAATTEVRPVPDSGASHGGSADGAAAGRRGPAGQVRH